jgi:hypothetical protein
MENSPPRSDRLLDLILFSLRDREALCALVLAAYRVELTSLLDRISSGSARGGSPSQASGVSARLGSNAAREPLAASSEEDAFLVYDLAGRIAEAAGAARLTMIRRDALALREKAAALHANGERTERDLLAAGLKLIERILDTTRVQSSGHSESAGTDLN